MAITKKEIDEIKSRLEKASPGPWRVASTTDGEYILDCDDWVVAATFERKEDAYFVAHAREDIPQLVAEVERLRETIKVAERELWWGNAESACVRVSEILKEAISNV